ncbi:exodeoxyribonuclease III [Myxococcus stipitatus DSM 14675]|uniref:Exodeoxyribonuclease III n=1 Tax=Myxococcus stipitatus (strain DSM 14675 / JCM 12634 / Mx s8) TaxID=1278073 RepID=L7UHE1_MYXSD|nr:exodeoxyribonuclease III [Myxococcus stipitatus]AGC46952.1 exodeoxyribonuclease III [Myxococcus stipitatus DSM 14675]
MKIATWNVNSVRARQERLLEWLKSAQPDVLCLQELKCTEDDFPMEAVRDAGYHAAVHGQKTYNGVAILAKEEPRDVVKGLSDGVDDTHARLIAATVGGLRVVSAYAPNGQSLDSPQYEYKLEWYGRLRRYLDTRHNPDEALVLGGDWNIAPADIDIYDPKEWEGQTLCTVRERDALPVRLRAVGCVPEAVPRHAALLVVGLPDVGLPEEPGPAHRPPVRVRAVGAAVDGGGHGPGGSQGQAALGPCAGVAGASGLTEGNGP